MKGFFTSSELKTTHNTNQYPQCGKCGLSKKCFSPKMKPTGTYKRKILFIAEAPGQEEDKQGLQLTGEAGEILDKALKRCGVQLEDCMITNAIICHPPKNKPELFMLDCCRPNLIKTIKELKPHVIIPLGGLANTAVLKDIWSKDVGMINTWAGWTVPLVKFNCWLCPTFHPSYLLRMQKDPCLINTFTEHLKKACSLERKKPRPENFEQLKNQVEIIENPKSAFLKMKELSEKKGTLAFDYETTGLKPEHPSQRIVSVSFCLNGKETFALMLHNKHQKILKKILTSSNFRKVASNLKFEERWTRTKLGYGVKNWHWDTMLMAHILANDKKKKSSVKFQSFVHLGINDYDSHISSFLKAKDSNSLNQIHKIPKKDLLLYNGLDSLLEYKVMQIQKNLFQ